jgi:hypothetical protein
VFYDSLPYCAADVDSMAACLSKLGFKVVAFKNLSRDSITIAVENWINLIDQYEVSLFYYTGHGIYLGCDYIVPIDAKIDIIADVADQCLPLSYITKRLSRKNRKSDIILIDACRTNLNYLGETYDLNTIQDKPRAGIFIGYSTLRGGESFFEPNRALSCFTSAIIDHISDPTSLMGVFAKIKREVKYISKQKQVPFYYNGLAKSYVLSSKSSTYY